jgi:uncharacterized protein YecT (DUF1311 family)
MDRLSGLFFFGFAAALLASRLAFAQAGKDCSQATMRELGECYYRSYQRADAELNKVYRRLTDRLADPSERELLQQAEQAWAQYRDKQCAFETAGARVVPIHPVAVSTCLWEKTRAHIEELQHQLNCPEGDPTCVHPFKEGGDGH